MKVFLLKSVTFSFYSSTGRIIKPLVSFSTEDFEQKDAEFLIASKLGVALATANSNSTIG